MTDAELDALEAKAMGATSGPWRVMRPDGWVVTDNVFIETDALPRNAEYIAAANPAVILEMVREIRRLRKEKEH